RASGDIDLAVLRHADEKPLPGAEAVNYTLAQQIEILQSKFKGILPDRFVEPQINPKTGKTEYLTDFDYAKYENMSLRGLDSSLRGRALFADGKYVGRHTSALFGEGGAIVRDFGQFFDTVPQQLQGGLSNRFNVQT